GVLRPVDRAGNDHAHRRTCEGAVLDRDQPAAMAYVDAQLIEWHATSAQRAVYPRERHERGQARQGGPAREDEVANLGMRIDRPARRAEVYRSLDDQMSSLGVAVWAQGLDQ